MIQVEKILTDIIGNAKTHYRVINFNSSHKDMNQLQGYSSFEGSSFLLARMAEISTPAHLKDLEIFINYLKDQYPSTQFRIVSQQIQDVHEYPAILWHTLLLNLDDRISDISHINILTPPFFVNNDRMSSTKKSTMGVFAKLSNFDGLLQYCDWFNEELKKIPFFLDMLDLYRVQARVEDFSHEIESSILTNFRNKIRELKKEAAQKTFSQKNPNLAELEKNLFDLYLSIQENLKNICNSIDSLNLYIEEVEKPHPELRKIKKMGLILKELILEENVITYIEQSDWARKILLLSLLDCYLGVTPIVNHISNDDRSSFPFAIKMATNQFAINGKIKQLALLSLNWAEIIKEIHNCFCTKGPKDYEKWLKTHEESDLHHYATFLHYFRVTIFKNLQAFSYPFKKEIQISDGKLRELAGNCSNHFLDLLPESFIEYNFETHKPIGLSLNGIKHLLPLLLG